MANPVVFFDIVIDLEPAASSCTAATGREYAAFLARVRTALHPLPVRVYCEQWQYHTIETFFSFKQDSMAAGKAVSGITYDGLAKSKVEFNTAVALKSWTTRLTWLIDDLKDGLHSASLLAAGLSTDSGYDSPAVAARVQKLTEAGVTEIHVFTDSVPDAWVAPLRRFSQLKTEDTELPDHTPSRG